MITHKEYKNWWKVNGFKTSLTEMPEEIREFNRRSKSVVDTHDWVFVETKEHKYPCFY